MKVTVSKPEKSLVTITIEASEEDVAKYLGKAAEELSTQVKIDGFRAGHATCLVRGNNNIHKRLEGTALHFR